jgi:integrase
MVDTDVPFTAPTHGNETASLGEPVDFDVRGLGRLLPRTEAPEGWVKKIDRQRGGKVWVGFFHIWTAEANGYRVRRKKEKTLGPASMPKHEAQSKLADYIEEFTGRVSKQGATIATFAELWKAFCAVRSGRWSKKTREDLRYLFAKHVLPSLENQPPREVTLTSLQLLLNRMAEVGYGATAVGRVRTYIKACFEYAADEDIVEKNPARKLVMPNIRKKSCERFLTVDELRAILGHAAPREHLVLRILAVCGLRPAEALVLRIEDFEGVQLRIDEALKERQKGEDRIGNTKTTESDNYVPVPPDLAREIEVWIAGHPDRNDPRAFLFPNSTGTAFGVGNYLKRYLKPLAEQAGVDGVTFQAFRRTSSTHMQKHATVKDMQRHLRHSNPQMTLKHYAKVIPESLRSAVAALDAQIAGPRAEPECQQTGAKSKQKGRSPRRQVITEAPLPTVAS